MDIAGVLFDELANGKKGIYVLNSFLEHKKLEGTGFENISIDEIAQFDSDYQIFGLKWLETNDPRIAGSLEIDVSSMKHNLKEAADRKYPQSVPGTVWLCLLFILNGNKEVLTKFMKLALALLLGIEVGQVDGEQPVARIRKFITNIDSEVEKAKKSRDLHMLIELTFIKSLFETSTLKVLLG